MVVEDFGSGVKYIYALPDRNRKMTFDQKVETFLSVWQSFGYEISINYKNVFVCTNNLFTCIAQIKNKDDQMRITKGLEVT